MTQRLIPCFPYPAAGPGRPELLAEHPPSHNHHHHHCHHHTTREPDAQPEPTCARARSRTDSTPARAGPTVLPASQPQPPGFVRITLCPVRLSCVCTCPRLLAFGIVWRIRISHHVSYDPNFTSDRSPREPQNPLSHPDLGETPIFTLRPRPSQLNPLEVAARSTGLTLPAICPSSSRTNPPCESARYTLSTARRRYKIVSATYSVTTLATPFHGLRLRMAAGVRRKTAPVLES